MSVLPSQVVHAALALAIIQLVQTLLSLKSYLFNQRDIAKLATQHAGETQVPKGNSFIFTCQGMAAPLEQQRAYRAEPWKVRISLDPCFPDELHFRKIVFVELPPKNHFKMELERDPGDPKWLDVIEKDLHRQFPFHEMFVAREGHGQKDLYRVLKAYTIYRPDEGYCQAQAPVAAVLLMHMPAEVPDSMSTPLPEEGCRFYPSYD